MLMNPSENGKCTEQIELNRITARVMMNSQDRILEAVSDLKLSSAGVTSFTAGMLEYPELIPSCASTFANWENGRELVIQGTALGDMKPTAKLVAELVGEGN